MRGMAIRIIPEEENPNQTENPASCHFWAGEIRQVYAPFAYWHVIPVFLGCCYGDAGKKTVTTAINIRLSACPAKKCGVCKQLSVTFV